MEETPCSPLNFEVKDYLFMQKNRKRKEKIKKKFVTSKYNQEILAVFGVEKSPSVCVGGPTTFVKEFCLA